jgi:hypothetical protein
MPLNLNEYADNVIEKDGIFFCKNNVSVSYPEDGNQSCFVIEDNSFWFRHRNNCIVETVKKHSKDKFFFDIGGGNGFVSLGLQKSGIETVVVEPGMQGCLNAKSRGLNNIMCATLQDAAFRKGTIESAGLFDVVEHIENDVDFLKTLSEFLKSGAKLYLTVPSFNWLWSQEDKIAGHYRRYTLKSIKNVLKQAGYEVEYATYFFSILPFPILLFRCFPFWLGLAKKNEDLSKNQQEHKEKKGFLSTLINGIWKWELKRITHNKSIKFGGSCLVVAKKL